MSDELPVHGDPLRSLRLLWGKTEPPKRGPRAKASVAELVAAAIAIADEEGLEAVSTRRVADAVGISPMSFYTHIPGKAELFDLMLDAAMGLIFRKQRPAFTPKTWRKNLTFVAHAYRDGYLSHPWMLELATHRPVLGPNTMADYDLALSAIDGLGLDEIEMDLTVTLIGNYVYGAVRDAARAKLVKERSGMTDDQWWYTIAPFLETLDFSPFPVASRVGAVAGETYGLGDPARAFEFGLARLLDGLELMIEAKQARQRKPRARRPARHPR